MKKLKAYWLRFWHCLYYQNKYPLEDHRLTTGYDYKGKVCRIACACEENFWIREDNFKVPPYDVQET